MGLVTPADPVPVGELGRVHFTGIGGAGMSGIARILLARGVSVSGSDAAPSELLESLAALGADQQQMIGPAQQRDSAAQHIEILLFGKPPGVDQ